MISVLLKYTIKLFITLMKIPANIKPIQLFRVYGLRLVLNHLKSQKISKNGGFRMGLKDGLGVSRGTEISFVKKCAT